MTLLHPRSLMTLLLLLALAACSDSSVDGWFIISNPSGKGLTAGVVKNGGSSTMSLVQAPGGSEAFLLREKLEQEIREQYYAVGSDLVLEKRIGGGLVLESPAFAAGRRTLAAGFEMVLGQTQDNATLFKLTRPHAGGSLAETWWISGWSNLLILQDQNGVRIYREGKPIQIFELGAQVRTRGKSYEITDRMGKLLLLQPDIPPEPEQRMAYIEERKAVQFFDARGRVVAELPAKGIEIAPEGQPFFLMGSYPEGLADISDRPFSVLIPRHNRHLILLTR